MMKQHRRASWHCVPILCQHSSQCAADTTTEHTQSDHIEPLLLPPAEKCLPTDHCISAAFADSDELIHRCIGADSQYHREQCSSCGSNPAQQAIARGHNQESCSNQLQQTFFNYKASDRKKN